ncbi:flagellar biosynthesis protein FlhF [Kineothrix sp. MSJ-39]|uniref:flagellar biosynthesis protein FlhF n=1 Tax=Kineothrix sp. MSJ-39 TaxID=2841533 RepID=UPI001C1293BF|nr:flagellar biosynthesis protein FlhF [Kineothrix sp. MSJ-39]MBU5429331.1 flagellar biosynthesis protein FlhF [Kineothrix sp. MSJ-39]
MIIKKFQAKTEEAALELAKKELGSGVVVMNVKKIKKKGLFSIFKPQQVEVTVALEEEEKQNFREAVAKVSEIARQSEAAGNSQNVKPEPVQAIKQTKTEPEKQPEKPKQPEKKAQIIDSRQESVIEEKLSTLQNLLEKQIGDVQEKEKDSTEEEKKEDSNVAFFQLLYKMLLDNEIEEAYANQLVDELDGSVKPDMPIDYLLSVVYQKMVLKFGQIKTIQPAEKGPKLIYFIGPTGVGKTTTIAKIASRFSVVEKKKIVLLTADTYRIAAAEQLRTYANILDVPFRIIYTPQEIRNAIEDYAAYDYIFVDTSGHSQKNTDQRDDTLALLRAADGQAEKEVYLVVSATTKYRDLLNIADTYQKLTDFRLVFTKLDETQCQGNLFNLRLHTDAPMSYVTCGQNVPDDIGEFDAQKTVKLLLGGNQFE